MLRIREVDGSDDEIAEHLSALHTLTFLGDAPRVETDQGHWWLVYDGDNPVAFAGLTKSTYRSACGYLKRSGVLHSHRGRGLQRRLLRVREARARRNGWTMIVTDTTENVHSSNNLIASGYRLFLPPHPWGFQNSLY